MRNALIQRMTAMASNHLTPKVVEHFRKIGFDYTVSTALKEPNLQPHPWWGRPELPWLSSEMNPDGPFEDVYDPSEYLAENKGKICFDIVMPTC